MDLEGFRILRLTQRATNKRVLGMEKDLIIFGAVAKMKAFGKVLVPVK